MLPQDPLPYIWVNHFGEEDVQDFYRHFYALEFFSDVTEITVFVNSFGGELHNFLAMRSLIKQASKPVATVAVGKAMSCGALLAMSGTPGYRFASLECEFMIHEVIGSEIVGKNSDIAATAINFAHLNKKIFQYMEEDTKLTALEWKEKIQKVNNADLFFDSKKAQRYGMVDHVGLPSFDFLPSATRLGLYQRGK